MPGTHLYCEKCDTIRQHKAMPYPSFGGGSGRASHEDMSGNSIHCFNRYRKCLTCEHESTTSEVNINYVFELISLRNYMIENGLHKEAEARKNPFYELAKHMNNLLDDD